MKWYGAALQDASRVIMAILFLAVVLSGCSQPDGSSAQQATGSSAAVSEAEASSHGGGDPATIVDDVSASRTSASNGVVDRGADEIHSASGAAADPSGRATLTSAESVVDNLADPDGGSETGSDDTSLTPLGAPASIDVPPDMAPVAGPTREQTAPQGSATNRAPTNDTNQPSGTTQPVREPLFVGWPKPRVALVITGRQFGYMEPCGCSGLENQNGGLVRRSTLLKQLTEKGWPVIPIDAGNQVRRFGRQAEIKFQFTINGLRDMGYRAIALGPDDLRLPAIELVGMILNSGIDPNPFVAANVCVMDDPSFTSTSPYLVLEQGGKKIGITAILGERNQKLVQNSEIKLRPAEEGIREVWPKLQMARCDLYVLIAHATTEESIALGQKFPQFKVVITTGGAGEPMRQPDTIEGTDCQLVDTGTKGMYAGVVALFDDPTTPLRYQRIPLDARFPDSEPMLQVLRQYQDQLKEAGFEGLGVRPQPLPGGGKFIGSKACEDCHEDEYKIWKEGAQEHGERHAHAYATLQDPPKRSKIPRNYDPECISCHVVGWNPQKYYPYVSGFWSLEKTPELINVGCENCHGPGAEHTAAENGDIEMEEDEMQALRQQQVLELKDAEKKCLECHDLDNSPAFQEKGAFDRYWEKINHGGEKKDKKASKK